MASQCPGQRASGCIVQHADADFRRISPGTCSQRRNYPDIMLRAVLDQCCFRVEAVNGVNYEIQIRRDQFIRRITVKKGMPHIQLQVGIDGEQAYPAGLDFGRADICRQSNQLAVDIGCLDDIAINDAELAYAGTDKGFCGIGTYPAQTDYRDSRLLQPFESDTAVEHDAPGKKIAIHVFFHSDYILLKRS
ncbi:MAG: hypothetical protein A4E71_01007 [Smithella sp. PtaU1.Bin162]|nr:MAG: hypothetical protein A4E71_01007 [Smithella sp. PtaU1.Bin162]